MVQIDASPFLQWVKQQPRRKPHFSPLLLQHQAKFSVIVAQPVNSMDMIMELTTRTYRYKHIALVAHDHCKQMLLYPGSSPSVLAGKARPLSATGTTGNLIHRETGLEVNAMLSGPMGR